jgi:hypothetical protein
MMMMRRFATPFEALKKPTQIVTSSFAMPAKDKWGQNDTHKLPECH